MISVIVIIIFVILAFIVYKYQTRYQDLSCVNIPKQDSSSIPKDIYGVPHYTWLKL